MRFPSFEQTVPYFSLSQEAVNILPVITDGDYADDINYHYFQLLHPARPCQLWGQLPVEEPPPAAEHSLAEPSDCATLFTPPFLSQSIVFTLSSSCRGLCFGVSIFLCPFSLCSQCQWVLEAPHTEESRPTNEWGEVEVNCEEIWDELWGNPWHRLYRFLNLSHLHLLLLFYSPLSIPSRVYTLALVTFLSLNLCALSLLFPLSLTPDMKHPFLPHEIWRGPS